MIKELQSLDSSHAFLRKNVLLINN